MPNANNGALRALKRAKKEAKRTQTEGARISLIASRSQTPPIDLSEPRAKKHFIDPPPPPPSLYKAREAGRG